MKNVLLGCSVFLLLAPLPGRSQTSAEAIAGVKATLQQMFDGMRTADSSLFKSAFLPQARLQTIALDSGGYAQVTDANIEAFAARIGRTPAGVLDERLGYTLILADGPLATAWTHYFFYLQGSLHHCGVNAFQLAHTPDGWRILQVADTRRTTGCTADTADVAATALHTTIDQWHRAAATADADAFFGAMTPDGIYLGTDASERWLRDELRSWAAFAFERESAWDFTPTNRHLYFSHDQQYAWWEESLDTWMGPCRGSGVARLTSEGWRITHYHLSITVPNDKVQDFIQLINKE